VRVYDLKALSPAAEQFVLKGHELEINDVAVSPDGHWLATGGRDAILRLWDLQNRQNISHPISLQEHEGWISAMTFSNDGRYLATGGYDNTIRLWRMNDKAPKVEHVLTGHEGPIKTLQFSEKSNLLVSLGMDHKVRLWNLELGNPSETSLVFDSPTVPFTATMITNDSRWLILAQPKANPKNQPGLRLWPLKFEETLDCAEKFANTKFPPDSNIPKPNYPMITASFPQERIALTPSYHQVTPLPAITDQQPPNIPSSETSKGVEFSIR